MDQFVILGVKVTDPTQLATIEAEMATLAQRHGLELVRVNSGSQDEIEELRQQIEAANRVKFGIIADFCHEIRTPFGTVLGYSEMLLEHTRGKFELNRDEADYLERILRAGQYQLSMTSDLLDFANIESGNFSVDLSAFKVIDLVSEDEIRHFQKGSATIVASYALDVGEMYSDPTEIRQIIFAALGIASKTSDAKKVGLTVTREGDYLKFLINALGMVYGKRAEFDFKYITWPLAQRRCEILRGTLDATYDESHLEITLRLPARLD